MKYFAINLSILILTSYSAYAQDYIIQKDITFKVIQLFESNQIGEVYNYFDDNMKVAISEEKLRTIWLSLPIKCGAYLGAGDAIASEIQGVIVVNQLLDFENTDLDIRLAFDAENKISGLHFVPPVKKE